LESSWKEAVVVWTIQISVQTVHVLADTQTAYKCCHSENLVHTSLCITSNLGCNLFSWHTLRQRLGMWCSVTGSTESNFS
jgi:hypothetical protein